MKLAVTGGRDTVWTIDHSLALLTALKMFEVTELLHGDCRGADRKAALLARASGLMVTAYPADWSKGKRAGPERNARMVAEADMLLAFPGGRGTADAVKKALARGIRVVGVVKKRPEAMEPEAVN